MRRTSKRRSSQAPNNFSPQTEAVRRLVEIVPNQICNRKAFIAPDGERFELELNSGRQRVFKADPRNELRRHASINYHDSMVEGKMQQNISLQIPQHFSIPSPNKAKMHRGQKEPELSEGNLKKLCAGSPPQIMLRLAFLPTLRQPAILWKRYMLLPDS